MRRRHCVTCLYLSKEEEQKLNTLCKDTNKTKNEIIRETLEHLSILIPPPVEYNYLIKEIRRVGTILDQLLMVLRNTGYLNVGDLTNALKELRAVEEKVIDKFSFEFKKVSYGDG